MSGSRTKPGARGRPRHGRWRARLTRAALHMCLFVPIVTVGAAASGCKVEVEPAEVKAPKRPENVPGDAVWVAGAGGGHFLSVRSAGVFRPDLYSIEVYDARTGSRLHRGALRLEPARSGRFPVGEATSYSSWDGATLLLTDGRRLVTPAPGG